MMPIDDMAICEAELTVARGRALLRHVWSTSTKDGWIAHQWIPHGFLELSGSAPRLGECTDRLMSKTCPLHEVGDRIPKRYVRDGLGPYLGSLTGSSRTKRRGRGWFNIATELRPGNPLRPSRRREYVDSPSRERSRLG